MSKPNMKAVRELNEMIQEKATRDHWRRAYAGQAMQGLLASSVDSDCIPERLAPVAVEFADELLRCVEQRENQEAGFIVEAIQEDFE